MNNIAVPNRTDAVGVHDPVRALRLVFAATILTFLLVSFTPFVLEYETDVQGNIVNQLGYSALALVAIVGHFLFTDRAVALSLLRPVWLLTIILLGFSVLQSEAPGEAIRAILFTLAAMLAMTGALSLPPSIRDFRLALAIAALVVLGLSYLGIAAYPGVAIHGSDGFEPQHAGLWRGIYSHKNVAGPVMAMLFFAGLYLMRCGDRWAGFVISVLSAIFIYKTGSKTTLALVPLVALFVAGGRIFGGRLLPIAVLSLAIIVTALLTLGAAISPALDIVLQAVLPGTTFTGRLDLWRFALDLMGHHQWTGFGVETFWNTGIVYKAEAPFELSWDPRLIVNAHNGYLEIAIWGGWPTLAVAALMLVLLPFKDYLTTRPAVENRRLADFLLMVLAFALLNSFFESYFFSRGNPVWLLTWLAIVGLWLCSRFRLE